MGLWTGQIDRMRKPESGYIRFNLFDFRSSQTIPIHFSFLLFSRHCGPHDHYYIEIGSFESLFDIGNRSKETDARPLSSFTTVGVGFDFSVECILSTFTRTSPTLRSSPVLANFPQKMKLKRTEKKKANEQVANWIWHAATTCILTACVLPMRVLLPVRQHEQRLGMST